MWTVHLGKFHLRNIHFYQHDYETPCGCDPASVHWFELWPADVGENKKDLASDLHESEQTDIWSFNQIITQNLKTFEFRFCVAKDFLEVRGVLSRWLETD